MHTRREIIKYGLSLAAIAGVRTVEADQTRSGSKTDSLKLGLVTYNLAASWDIPTIIRRCKSAAYAAVELRTSHAHGVEPDIGAIRRHEVKKMFNDSGIVLWGLGTVCEFQNRDAAQVRQSIEQSKRFCELAKDVGAKGVKVRPNGLVDGIPEETTLQQIGSALRECGEAAGDNGVELWVEMHGNKTSQPSRMRRIMDIANHPSVGVVWNSNAVDVRNGDIAESFALMKKFIRSVHIHDLIDDYPYYELFASLKTLGYDRYTLMEMPGLKTVGMSEEDILRFMRYYRRFWQELVKGC